MKMGVSTDSILCYGIPIDESSDWKCLPNYKDENLPDFEDRLALLCGVEKPSEPYQSGKDSESQRIQQLYSDYWKQKQNAVESIAKITLVRHCSGDYPMYILAAFKSVKRANRGYPHFLNKEDFEIDPEWREKIKWICEVSGLEFKEPQWILCSMWN